MDRDQHAQTFRRSLLGVLARCLALITLSLNAPASAQGLSEAEQLEAVTELAQRFGKLDWPLIFEMERVCSGYAGVLDLEEAVGYKMNFPEMGARLLIGQMQALGEILGLTPWETAEEAKQALKGETASPKRRVLKAYYEQTLAVRTSMKEIGVGNANAFLRRGPTQEQMVAHCQYLADGIVQNLLDAEVPLFDGPRDDPLFKKR